MHRRQRSHVVVVTRFILLLFADACAMQLRKQGLAREEDDRDW